ncbi:LysR family transcriptional regulator [Marinitenerispora sediminis]|nr:LysR family transcriptional regulator [Marinitenerispora sediminis]RCV48435.1 LysR family transcriptional regulator [Marinitenerispora sediminis]RCV50145.1 LysR family transcriptional regulator [Marinitenerispora sediminis]
MLDLRQLEYFVAVAEESSITRAARRLRMAQPALSQAITRLERRLGARLFDRGGREVRPTAAGFALLPEARFLLARARELADALPASGGLPPLPLRVGCAASAVSGLLPRVLPDFLHRRPDVRPVVREMGQHAQLTALRRGEIDVGICRLRRGEDGIVLRPLRDERLYCALPAEHPLAAAGSVALETFAGQDLVGFPRDMAPVAYDAIVSACVRAGFSPRFVQEAGNCQAILGVVACGIAVAVVPELTTRVRIPGVVCVPLSDPFAVTPLSVVFGEGEPAPQALAFADAVAAAFG